MWYEIKKETDWTDDKYKYVWTVKPLNVVKQTARCVYVRREWPETAYQKAGFMDDRRLMDGDIFDDLAAANAAVRDRLQKEYERATEKYISAGNAVRDWKDVTL